jgi:hypothetical protein
MRLLRRTLNCKRIIKWSEDKGKMIFPVGGRYILNMSGLGGQVS